MTNPAIPPASIRAQLEKAVGACAKVAEAMNESIHTTAESTKEDRAFVEGYDEACADIARYLRTKLRGESLGAVGDPRMAAALQELEAALAGGAVLPSQELRQCPHCFGTGYIPSETCDECPDCQDTCPTCGGTGKQAALAVSVPEGLKKENADFLSLAQGEGKLAALPEGARPPDPPLNGIQQRLAAIAYMLPLRVEFDGNGARLICSGESHEADNDAPLMWAVGAEGVRDIPTPFSDFIVNAPRDIAYLLQRAAPGPDPSAAGKVSCPHCPSEEITRIYRPEVYEYRFFCKQCDKGFN